MRENVPQNKWVQGTRDTRAMNLVVLIMLRLLLLLLLLL